MKMESKKEYIGGMNMSKIIQIIPAPENMYVLYHNNGPTLKNRVVAIALWSNGDVTLLDVDNEGRVNIVKTDDVISTIYK